MPDELDLREIDALLINPHWSLDVDLVRHMYHLRAEVGRLRGLLVEEQAKTAHARCWAHWHQNENPFTLNPGDYPRIEERASDGWYGSSGSFDAPDDVEEE